MLHKTARMVGLFAAVAAMASTTFIAGPASGQTNVGIPNPATWVPGHLYDPPANHPIWNPAKVKRLAGQDVVLGTQLTYSLTGYCTVAGRTGNGASDATWTEMQHALVDWTQAWSMWSQPCAYTATVVPGARVAYTHKREIQKALDGGVMTLVVPTVDSLAEAQDIIDMVYYPPIGHRIYGPSQARQIYANVPGGYRQTFNDNVVLIMMIETVLGSQAASSIGTLAHLDGLFGATSDLGNFSGYAGGMVDYEKLIRNTYDAAHTHSEGACSAFGFKGRVANANFPAPYGGFVYSFNCYQN